MLSPQTWGKLKEVSNLGFDFKSCVHPSAWKQICLDAVPLSSFKLIHNRWVHGPKWVLNLREWYLSKKLGILKFHLESVVPMNYTWNCTWMYNEIVQHFLTHSPHIFWCVSRASNCLPNTTCWHGDCFAWQMPTVNFNASLQHQDTVTKK